jgi:DedD protein
MPQTLQSFAMEVRVRERLVGALVLVAIVVLLVPSILKGRDPAPPGTPDQLTKRVEVPVELDEAAPADDVLVPEQDLPDAPAPVVVPPPQETAPVKAQVLPERPAEIAPPATRPAKAPAALVPSEAPAWAVQLGAFSNRAKADQMVLELRKRGYAAFVLEYRATGQVLYRVRVGPEQDRDRAVEIAARLAKDGFQPVVARHP